MADPYYPPAGQPIPPVVTDPIGAGRPPGVFESKGDNAKFIVQLRRFKRPRVYIPNGAMFVWPLGTEGVRVSGSAKLGIHTFMGDNNAEVQVIHSNEGRIEMSGMFLGETGAANVRILKNVITADYPASGLKLDIPGVFTYEHDVYVESYEFDHAEENEAEDWTYRVTFVDAGHNRKRLPNLKTTQPPANPTPHKGKGKPPTYLVVKDGMRTLRAISKKAFGTTTKWKMLYDANKTALDDLMRSKGIPFSSLPTTLLPIGMRIRLSIPLRTATPASNRSQSIGNPRGSAVGGESL